MQLAVIANPKFSDASADCGRSGCDTNDYAEMVLITKFPVRPFPCLRTVSAYPAGVRAGIFMHGSQVERVKSILYLSFRE